MCIRDRTISHNKALVFAIILALASFLSLYFLNNLLAAVLAFLGGFFYVVIYTLYLKKRTVQNIVVGGAAGAFPPLVGYAAISNTITLEAIYLFVIIFFWTPPHFWALALYRSDQYKAAGIPMMPWVHGPRRTLTEMRVYALILIGIAAMPWLNPSEVGELSAYLYTLIVLLLGIWYNQSVISINVNQPLDEKGRIPSAARSFYISLSYLALIFVSLVSVLFSPELTIMFLVLIMLNILSKIFRRKSSSEPSIASD